MSTLSRRSVLALAGVVAAPLVVAGGARPASAADDTYESNTELYKENTEGVDYARRFRRHAAFDDSDAPGGSYPDTAIVALHGGGIEPGTSELCLAVAGYHPAGGATGGPLYDYWLLEGIRSSGNAALHVTSTNCDDPVALATVGGSRRTVSLHGCSTTEAGVADGEAAVLVGGLDTVLKNALIQAYTAAGIQAIDGNTVPALSGSDTGNIVNLNVPKKGVQLEMTTPLRTGMFAPGSTTRTRKNSLQPSFWAFVNATRSALA